jgi:uncharacterized membrane protein
LALSESGRFTEERMVIRKFKEHAAPLLTTILALSCFCSAFLWDLAYFSTNDSLWINAAWGMVTAGIAVGLIAVSLDWLDWLTLSHASPRRTLCLAKALLLAAVVLIYLGHWHFRQLTPGTLGPRAVLLSFLGASLAFVVALLTKEIQNRRGTYAIRRALN